MYPLLTVGLQFGSRLALAFYSLLRLVRPLHHADTVILSHGLPAWLTDWPLVLVQAGDVDMQEFFKERDAWCVGMQDVVRKSAEC